MGTVAEVPGEVGPGHGWPTVAESDQAGRHECSRSTKSPSLVDRQPTMESCPDRSRRSSSRSDDPAYISRKIRERLKGTSVTVVLIGNVTAQSIWVSREIQWSLEKNPPNGILGISLDPDASVPDELIERGAEILKWYRPEDVHEFQDAIERASMAARSARLMPTNSASTCAR